MPPGDVAETIVDFVARFSTYFGIPQRLRDLDVREEDLPGYADTAMRDACMTTNPRVVTRAAVLSLLSAAY